MDIPDLFFLRETEELIREEEGKGRGGTGTDGGKRNCGRDVGM